MSEFTTRDQVAARLRELFVSLPLVEDGAEIRETSALQGDLGLDSLDRIEMTIAAEEVFGISEELDDEVEKVKTFGELVDLFCSKLKIGAPA